MKNIGEIKTDISQFKNDTNFTQLQSRWQTDFDLWREKPYNAGKGYYSYTSNYARVFADKLINMLVESALLIRVPEEVLTDEEVRTANNVERFLYGSFNLNDEKLLLLPDMPTLRDQMAWYAIVRGGFGLRVYIHKNDEGETIPDISVWDLYNMSYGRSNKGLPWGAHSYKMPKRQAEEEYGVKTGTTGDVDAIDIWNEEEYGLIIADQWGTEPTAHNCGHCPVFILRAGAMPPVWQKNYQFTGKHVGESAFPAIRELMPIINKTMSDYLTMVRRGVKVPLGIWSNDGSVTIDEDIFQTEKAAVVPFRSDVKIEPLIKETMPQDATPFLNFISGELQRGGLPHTAFGELGFRLSGFAINQLQGQLSTVVTPFAQVIQRAYTIASLELLKQYSKKKNLPAVKVRGRTARNEAFGFPKADVIKASDIDGDWHPEIKLEPILPKDDAQKAQLAQVFRDGERPLLADETIQSELLGVRDTDLEAQKIDRQWANNLVINKLWTAYMASVEEGDMMRAENILAELRRLMMQMGGQPPGQGQRGQMGATAGAAMGMPGVGMPPGQTGVPASTLPPEASGGMPPGALNAQLPLIAEEF